MNGPNYHENNQGLFCENAKPYERIAAAPPVYVSDDEKRDNFNFRE